MCVHDCVLRVRVCVCVSQYTTVIQSNTNPQMQNIIIVNRIRKESKDTSATTYCSNLQISCCVV